MLLSKLPATMKQVKEFDYSAANVASKLQWVDVGPVKVGLVRKETKGDRVHVQFSVPLAGRKIVYPTAVAGDALSELMTEKTASLSKDALKSKLASMMTEIGVGISIESMSISITTTKASLAEALKIAREMLRTPVIDEVALQDYIRRSKDQINASRDEPQVLMQQKVPAMFLAEGDPRRPRSFDQVLAELDKLTVEAVLAFHREFLGADGMVGGIVGDVDPKDVEALFKPILADWKAAKPGVQEPNEGVDKLLSTEARIETPGKPSAISVMIQPIRLSVGSPDYSAVQAASSALFQDAMASRIPKKVRVEKALSYATGGMVVADLKGDFGMVILYTMTKPENSAKALELIRTELQEALKTGVTAEELATFKKGYANQVAQSRADDARLAGSIVTLKVAGKDFSLWNKLDEEAAKLTLDDVNAALRKYVDPSKMGTIQVGDFEGKKKEPKE
jgi:zinc protease